VSGGEGAHSANTPHLRLHSQTLSSPTRGEDQPRQSIQQQTARALFISNVAHKIYPTPPQRPHYAFVRIIEGAFVQPNVKRNVMSET